LPPLTLVRAGEPASALRDEEARQQFQLRLASQLIRRLNRLLRWYRVVSGNPSITEVSPWQVTPFRVIEPIDGVEALIGEIRYSADVFDIAEPLDNLASERLRTGLKSGAEPDVPSLFLRDAEFAALQGRFREAVLLSWATIDSQFSLIYKRLVQARLDGDYRAGIEELTGLEITLRTKMTVLMNLLAKSSLFILGADGAWERLSRSYAKRNGIIHRGEVADQRDAEDAVASAHWVMERLSPLARKPNRTDVDGDIEEDV
jgi:hypothetical protein